MSLPENYQNEILSPLMGNKRQYQVIENVNGTISFIDVSAYDQEGSFFQAEDINAITHQVNINVDDIELLKQSIPTTTVVSGVKGQAESEYRHGDVILSAANIGTYSKAEIDELLSILSTLHFEVVDTLPITDISTSTIYLVPSASSKTRNVKDEYIYIYSYNYTDITSFIDIYPDYSSLPSEGSESVYYITSDDGKVFEWDNTNQEYVQSEQYPTSEEVTTLPSEGLDDVIYINTTDNKVYTCVITGEWEQIGTTAIDLSDYYTKTQIDNGSLITIVEFESLS